MRTRSPRLPLLCLFALALTACATTPAPSASASPPPPPAPLQSVAYVDNAAVDKIAHRLGLERYVRTVFVRLTTANADLCGDHLMAEFGMRFATIDSMAEEMRPTALASGLLSKVPVVFFAGPGLPAAEAGIEIGDHLVGIERKRLPPGEPAMGQFSDAVHRAVRSRGAVRFTLERRGTEYEAELAPVPACAANIYLDTMPVPNAFTDGDDVLILAGILDVARTQSELAIVIGHELGHVIEEKRLGAKHREADPMRAEMEADRIGLYLAARAGYDIRGGTIVMERIVADYPLAAAGGEHHPSSLLRIAAMKATEQEIAAKQAAHQPLWPYAPES